MNKREVITDWKKRPVDLIFFMGYKRKKEGKCPTCEKEMTEEELESLEPIEWDEYRISGTCKACQLKVFGKTNYEQIDNRNL